MLPESEFSQPLPAGISVLICTYNGVPRLPETLAHLARQVVAPGLPWEVILVDNASTDGTAAMAQAYWQQLAPGAPLRLFAEPQPGKNLAVKRAFGQARYRYACIVDDDNWLAPDYLQLGFDLLEAHPAAGILGGQNTGVFETAPPAWFPQFREYYAVGEPMGNVGGQYGPLPEGNIERNVLWGAGMFVRLALWQQLQALQFRSLFAGRQGTSSLTAGEDDEMCYVAQLLGYQVWYCARLHLHHYMTAGRLTVGYRDRLFYSPIWSASRLGAYQSALASAATSASSGPAMRACKDFLYRAWSALQRVASPAGLRAIREHDTLYLMNSQQQLLAVYNWLRHFGRVIQHYRTVTDLREKALRRRQAPLTSGR